MGCAWFYLIPNLRCIVIRRNILQFFWESTPKIIVTVLNKTFKNGDRIVAKATHITSLTECPRCFGRKNKLKMIHGKVLSICDKKTISGRNSQHVCAQFDLGGGSTKIADVNTRSIEAAQEKSNTIEQQSVALAEEQVPPNPTVDDGETNAVTATEDDATQVVTDVSSTTGTIFHTAQILLDDVNITDDRNGGKMR